MVIDPSPPLSFPLLFVRFLCVSLSHHLMHTYFTLYVTAVLSFATLPLCSLVPAPRISSLHLPIWYIFFDFTYTFGGWSTRRYRLAASVVASLGRLRCI